MVESIIYNPVSKVEIFFRLIEANMLHRTAKVASIEVLQTWKMALLKALLRQQDFEYVSCTSIFVKFLLQSVTKSLMRCIFFL